MELTVNALMLRAADYNDNDKILTLLTAENGKLTAGIKGVKKAGAKLKFAAQPFCFAEYTLTKKGEKYTVTGCSEIESFYDLRTDIGKFYAASAVAEAALSLTFEGLGCGDIFYGTVKALSRICTGDECEALIGYLVFALEKSGYALAAENCPHCGRPLFNEDKLRFDMNIGAFTCADCGNGPGASRVTYNAIRKILGKDFQSGFITPDGNKRALKLLREYFAYKTDGKLTALSEYIRLL